MQFRVSFLLMSLLLLISCVTPNGSLSSFHNEDEHYKEGDLIEISSPIESIGAHIMKIGGPETIRKVHFECDGGANAPTECVKKGQITYTIYGVPDIGLGLRRGEKVQLQAKVKKVSGNLNDDLDFIAWKPEYATSKQNDLNKSEIDKKNRAAEEVQYKNSAEFAKVVSCETQEKIDENQAIINEQNEITKISGTINAYKLHEAATNIVELRGNLKNAQAAYKERAGHSLNMKECSDSK